MGKTGRLIKEKEWPFQADWYSMMFSIAGTGFILERAGECAPVMTQDPRTIDVKEGYVISPTASIKHFPGNTVQLDGNPDKHPRLDLLYLRENPDDSTKMELVVEKGTPAERPKAPQLPDPDNQKVVPIAVVGFQGYMDQVHDIFDARSVMDQGHHHGAGDALNLDQLSGEMSVKTDSKTIVMQDGQLHVDNTQIDPADLNITWENGLEVNASGGIRVDKGYGLRFDHAESVATENLELWFDAAAVGGYALIEDGGSGQLMVDTGNGVAAGSSAINMDVGDGFAFDSGQLEADLVSGGGLKFDADGKIFVDPNDFVSGSGLGVSSGDIDLTPGTGLKIETDLRTDETNGLRIWDEKLEIRPGFGIEFNTNGEVRLNDSEIVGELAGSGLGTDSGQLFIGAYDGLVISSGQLEVDVGSSLTKTSGAVELAVDGTTLEISSGYLQVDPAGIAGDGLQDAAPMVTLEMDNGGNGTTSPSKGFHEYAPGTEVTIEAYPDADYQFSAWGGDITSYNNPETITVNSDTYVIAYFEPEGIDSTQDEEEDLSGASDTDNDLHAGLADGITLDENDALKIDNGFGVDAAVGDPVTIDRSEIFGTSISTFTDSDGVVRGKTDFFSHAFQKVDYDSLVSLDASDPTNYTTASVDSKHSGHDIWIFTSILSGADSYQNELEVIYEQGSSNQDWWSTIRLENVGDQDGNEQGTMDIKFLALTPEWMGSG